MWSKRAFGFILMVFCLACGKANTAPADSSVTRTDAATAEDGGQAGMDVAPISLDATSPIEDSGIQRDVGITSPDASVMRPEENYTRAQHDGEVVYQTRYSTGQNSDRTVKYRAHYPMGFSEAAPVIIVSHGGSGSVRGHMAFGHLAEEYATHGYVSIHLNHNASAGGVYHRIDRPRDVEAIIDALPSILAGLPSEFGGTFDITKIAHIGHSWGAYTAHAVGGADFLNPVNTGRRIWNFRNPSVKAFVALSPQGFGSFGAFDITGEITETSTSNSWLKVDIPAFNLIGEAEMDGIVGVENIQNCPECFRATDWRLFPFTRYPADDTKFVAVLPNGTHSDLGSNGPTAIKNYIAKNSRLFFDVYLKGYAERKSQIGQVDSIAGIDFRRK